MRSNILRLPGVVTGALRIPDGWRVQGIREFASVKAGSTPSRKLAGRYYDGATVSWVKTGDLTNGSISDTEERITEAALLDTTCEMHPSGTVLIAMYGGFRQIGRTGLLKIKAATNQAVAAVIHDSSSVMSEYLLQWLNLNIGYWRKVAASSRKDPNITKRDIERFPVLCPALSEQRIIVAIVAAWERAIEQVSKLIKAKTRLKRGLMQQLLVGNRRFPQFVNSDAKRPTRFGSVPTDWDYVEIGKIADEVKERNQDGAELPVLSCTKYDGLVDSLEYFGKRVFSKDTSNYKIVRKGQFAYATNHIEEGSIGLLERVPMGLVSPMYTVFETGDSVHAPFLYTLLKTESYRHIFATSTNASVNRRGSLRWKQFSKIRVALPALEEQKAIDEVIRTCEKEISSLKIVLENLNNQKKGLMQVLLTGKVPVIFRGVKSDGGTS